MKISTKKSSLEKPAQNTIKHAKTESSFFISIIKNNKSKSKEKREIKTEKSKSLCLNTALTQDQSNDSLFSIMKIIRIEEKYRKDVKTIISDGLKLKKNYVFLICSKYDCYQFVGIYDFMIETSSFAKVYSPYNSSPQLFGMYKVKRCYYMQSDVLLPLKNPLLNKVLIKAVFI